MIIFTCRCIYVLLVYVLLMLAFLLSLHRWDFSFQPSSNVHRGFFSFSGIHFITCRQMLIYAIVVTFTFTWSICKGQWWKMPNHNCNANVRTSARSMLCGVHAHVCISLPGLLPARFGWGARLFPCDVFFLSPAGQFVSLQRLLKHGRESWCTVIMMVSVWAKR